MVWFRKKTVALTDLANFLAEQIVPVELSQEDASFCEMAVSAGADMEIFKFEMLTFQLFVFGQIINRERLERRLDSNKAAALAEEFLRVVVWRVGNVEGIQALPSRLTPEARSKMVSTMIDIHDQYVQLIVRESSFAGAPKLFAKECGLPESEVLERIATTLLKFRGNTLGDFLSKVKIV